MSAAPGDPEQRLEWIDALRGVAILLVIFVHCGQRPVVGTVLRNLAAAAQYGVQLFFIVSAITISLTFERHVQAHGMNIRSALAWLVRRMFRIWPLYMTAAIGYACWHGLLHTFGNVLIDPRPTISTIVANIFFLQAWIPGADVLVPGGWSISVEASFYLAFPVIAACSPGSMRPRMLVVLAMFLYTASRACAWVASGTTHIDNATFFYYWPPTQLPVLLLGCAFYAASMRNGSFRESSSTLLPGSLALLTIPVAIYLGTWGSLSPASAPLLVGIGFCALARIAGTRVMDGIAARMLAGIGLASYSMYLVHFAVIDVARGLLKYLGWGRGPVGIGFIVVLTAGVAIFSFALSIPMRRLVEEPGISLGRRLGRQILAGARSGAAANGVHDHAR